MQVVVEQAGQRAMALVLAVVAAGKFAGIAAQ